MGVDLTNEMSDYYGKVAQEIKDLKTKNFFDKHPTCISVDTNNIKNI